MNHVYEVVQETAKQPEFNVLFYNKDGEHVKTEPHKVGDTVMIPTNIYAIEILPI